MSIDLLPNELILNILTFLNFRDKDILNSRLINKQICFVVDEPITTQGYPDVISNSLYFFEYKKLGERSWLRTISIKCSDSRSSAFCVKRGFVR